MSPKQMTDAYFSHINQEPKAIPAWHFCDNQKDADECAELTLKGIKRATSPSLWGLEVTKDPMPKVGDLNLVTDWQGNAICVIETTEVDIVPYNEITPEYAFLEGEGDKSLEYWQEVHWAYYQREFAGTKFEVQDNMPIICETFKVVFPV